MFYTESGLKVEQSSKTIDTLNETILVDATNQNPASICTWFNCRNKGEPSGSLKVPYVDLQRNRDSNMPHCTWKDSISKLSFLLPFESTRTETVVQLIRWDSHRHSADARRPVWIDLTMKTSSQPKRTASQPASQQPPNFSSPILHTYTYTTLQTKFTCILLTERNNSQNKRADLDGNFFGGSAVTVKSLYKLALHKIPLDGTFVCPNILKLYLLHSHARNNLITYK